MGCAQQSTDRVGAPRVFLDSSGTATVTRWGRVLGQILRPGDRLQLSDDHGPVVLLAPNGRGRPMLALRCGHRLLALPGRVPASPLRWHIVGSVSSIERDLERGAASLSDPHVAVRVRALDGAWVQTPADLTGGELDARQLDTLCIRAAVAPRLHKVIVSVAVAPTPALAQQLLAVTQPGCLRFSLTAPDVTAPDVTAPAVAVMAVLPPVGRVIPGPWAGTPVARRAQCWRRGARPVTSSSPQVPLPFRADKARSA